jgi:hypothetical protein
MISKLEILLLFQVAELRSRAINAMKIIGQFDETQLPPFIRPVKNLILKVQTLFNDIKTDVMTFYNVSHYLQY